MSNEIAVRNDLSQALEAQNRQNADVVALVTKGDLSKLSSEELVRVYIARCDALGLDVRATPFEVINFKGKTVLYPTKEAAEQLRRLNGISTTVVEESYNESTGIMRVRIRGVDRNGREDEEIAAIFTKGMQGIDLANAYMKCITKAKRRLTLSMCGLGQMSDVDDDDPRILRRQALDLETGEIVEVEDDETLNEKYEREQKEALARFHAAAADVGLDHDAAREYARRHHRGIESLTELDGRQLQALADIVKDEIRHEQTRKKFRAMSEIEEEHYQAILACEDLQCLDEQREKVIAGVINHPDVSDAYRARVKELGGSFKPATQPALAGVAEGEAGNDRHTNG